MTSNLTRRLLCLLMLSSLRLLAADGAEARLLRFPAIHGEKLVFTYAGNLSRSRPGAASRAD